MSYIATHTYIAERTNVPVVSSDGIATVRYSSSGRFTVRNAGQFVVELIAQCDTRIWVGDLDADAPPGAGRYQTSHVPLPVTIEVKTPDGLPFAADQVTMADLARFRDLRGASQGAWTYTAVGEREISFDEGGDHPSHVTAYADLEISVLEPVPSLGGPLVSETRAPGVTHRYQFDLFQVGLFTATARMKLPRSVSRGRPLRLIDPDGNVVASNDDGHLTWQVTLPELDKSRDANNSVRLWQLEVVESPSATANTLVHAAVTASKRIEASALHARINTMLGPNGSLVSIWGEIDDNDMVARFEILDKISAEIFDMRGLLDDVIKWPDADAKKKKNVDPHVEYTVWRHSRDLGYDLHVSIEGMRVSGIDVMVSASEKIQPSIPAVIAKVGIEGEVTIKLGGFPFGRARIRDNSISLEAGIALEQDGSFTPRTWVQDDRFDIDLAWEAAVATGIVTVGLLPLGLAGVVELIEHFLNDAIPAAFTEVMDRVMKKVPRTLEMMMGGEMAYTGYRMEGAAIVFDYHAPPELNRGPDPGYIGIVGRTATQLGAGVWNFMPRSLGNTWENANLSKIDHIVVVMMENRSHDHVLGYLGQLPGGEAHDGLTPELLDALAAVEPPAELRVDGALGVDGRYTPEHLGAPSSKIIPNALGFKTKFPAPVGHRLADVAEQLAKRMTMPSGRTINSPEGFITNFLDNITSGNDEQIDTKHVLGYHDAADLPFFGFLAEHHGYCEKYFCSHAGPTLPNRMFSLCGEVQYERSGEPILDNNDGSNFVLSRQQTIFDLLTRKGVGWRVYESPPSVTMLRMFARYVGDDTNIVPVSRFEQDVAAGDLPAFTVVDPAMHHFPQNDDHPVADMYNGQIFLKGVYDALRKNPDVWRKTLLVITYDEHGGFYDHALPLYAEARTRPEGSSTTGDAPAGAGWWTPSSLSTAYGVRVPTFVVSPLAPAGKGPDVVLDHCSILKTVLARFCPDRPFLSDRVDTAHTFDAFLSEPEARDIPDSPPMEPLDIFTEQPRLVGSGIDTEPVSRRGIEEGTVDSHELMGMLARLIGR